MKIRNTSMLREIVRGNLFYEDVLIQWKKHSLKKLRPRIEELMHDLYSKGCPIHRIEVETINACNCACSFCPVNVKADPRPRAYMADALFLKLLTELQSLGYKNGFFLSSNNEPFLDPKIVDRAKLARKMLPDAYLMIYTNGTLLDRPRYHGIMEYLDFMVIDNYSDDYTLRPSIKDTLDDAFPPELSRTLVFKRPLDDVMDTRGGNSPSRKKMPTYDIGCLNIFSEVVVTPTGDISLCCQDAWNQYPMGSIAKNTLMEVWYGSRFEDIRKRMLADHRYSRYICEKCDFFRKDPEEYRWMGTFKVKEQ